jgi:nucleotide-binding universal stress UspA family protein
MLLNRKIRKLTIYLASLNGDIMRVLAAIDGSSHSQCVLNTIAERVWEPGTEFKLTTVIKEHVEVPLHAHGGYHRISFEQSVEDPSHPHKRLAELSVSLRQMINLPSTDFSIDPVIKVGHPTDEILLLAKNWGANLIVVGAHGRTGLEKMFLGSVSTSILHHAMSNVSVAKLTQNTANKDVYRILVPVDHSLFSQAAVDWLVKQRWVKPVEIQLLTAIPEIYQLSSQFADEANLEQAASMLREIQSHKTESMAALNSLANEIRTRTNPKGVFCSVVAGAPKDTILSTAHHWQADLILMGSHGRSGLTRALLGSVSSEVVQNSHIAVEVVKPPANFASPPSI